jgi:hypothetical protein
VTLQSVTHSIGKLLHIPACNCSVSKFLDSSSAMMTVIVRDVESGCFAEKPSTLISLE